MRPCKSRFTMQANEVLHLLIKELYKTCRLQTIKLFIQLLQFHQIGGKQVHRGIGKRGLANLDLGLGKQSLHPPLKELFITLKQLS